MKPEVAGIIRGANLSGWKKVEVEYGATAFTVCVPRDCRILEMKEAPSLGDPQASISASINRPIGSGPLPEILKGKRKPADQLTVCITTSDITRPVPYKGDSGILPPLLELLHRTGIRKENITLLVGTGTHRPSTRDEKETMFGKEVVDQYTIVDHECDNPATLVSIGTTKSGTEILINRVYYAADVKIATGLVESHFMAGVSGGRKAICPALVSRKTIEKFHSAQFLDSRLATNLVLEGNPCHEEALEVAQKAGVDFIINTVLNRRLELLGVFSGD
ncbi:MAG TPA: lactate racemase domain-containing protein, partial [Spirochaetia bacterium]|nr:lactate racemase domain-containing protein [Spirochaetia bacterium]